MENTLEEMLNQDYPIGAFKETCTIFLLDCIQYKFIEYDDSKIYDIKFIPHDDFRGYFRLTVRKQLTDIFDITTHMVYIVSAFDLRDKYISTINVDFSNPEDKEYTEKNGQKIFTLMDQLQKLMDTIVKDFKCDRFNITLKEFEIPDTADDKMNSKTPEVINYSPIAGEAKSTIQTCIENVVNQFISKSGFMRYSKINMNTEIDIECNLSSIGVKSKGKLIFMINHIQNVDTVQFSTLAIPYVENIEDDVPEALSVALSSPTSNFSKGGIGLTIVDAETFGFCIAENDQKVLGYLDEYYEMISQNVSDRINKLTNDQNITINFKTEVI